MVLENRRKLIKARKADDSMQKLKCATEKRGRRPGTSNLHQITLEHSLLTQFFLPWRGYPGSISITSRSNVAGNCDRCMVMRVYVYIYGDILYYF